MAQLLNANRAVAAMVFPSSMAHETAYAVMGVGRCKNSHVSSPLGFWRKRDLERFFVRARATQSVRMTGVQAGDEVPRFPFSGVDTSDAEIDAAMQKILSLSADGRTHLFSVIAFSAPLATLLYSFPPLGVQIDAGPAITRPSIEILHDSLQ